MGKFHNVLYIALKVAWNWNIKDSAAICELLGEQGKKSLLKFHGVLFFLKC